MKSDCSHILRLGLFIAAVVLVGPRAAAQTSLEAPSGPNLVAPPLSTNAPVRQLSEDVYAIGQVRLNKKDRTIRFPCLVNLTNGLMEYAIVHQTGKVHESVLKTETDPFHIHLAALLLGWAPPDPSARKENEPRDLFGPRIRVGVEWKVNGVERRMPLEELVINSLTGARLTQGDWVYNGSRLVEGTFLAQRDGQVAAIIADQDALINNPRPGREDDEIWRPNGSVLPAVGSPVEITLYFPKSPEK